MMGDLEGGIVPYFLDWTDHMMADLESRIVLYFLDLTNYMMGDLEGRVVPYFLDWTDHMMGDLEDRIVPYFLDWVHVEQLMTTISHVLFTNNDNKENQQNRNIVQIKKLHCAAYKKLSSLYIGSYCKTALIEILHKSNP